jgi:hypothetical protein
MEGNTDGCEHWEAIDVHALTTSHPPNRDEMN